MNKLISVLAGAAAFLVAGTASAATIYAETVSGNDPFPNPLNDSPALAKCDEGADDFTTNRDCLDWVDGFAEGDYSSAFSVTFTGEQSFDWSFDASAVTGTMDVLDPIWIAVKAGSVFLVYQITGGDHSGSVDISGIIQQAISHVSFYDTGTVSEVPLPAAAWLMIAGAAGLGFAGRRKKSV